MSSSNIWATEDLRLSGSAQVELRRPGRWSHSSLACCPRRTFAFLPLSLRIFATTSLTFCKKRPEQNFKRKVTGTTRNSKLANQTSRTAGQPNVCESEKLSIRITQYCTAWPKTLLTFPDIYASSVFGATLFMSSTHAVTVVQHSRVLGPSTCKARTSQRKHYYNG